MADNAAEPFTDAAKVETFFKDFNRLREAIRRHDPEATEAAWDRCERWVTAMTPDPKETDR
jgi:hypothetical protein